MGHSSVTATSSYIGVSDNSALDLARTYSFLVSTSRFTGDIGEMNSLNDSKNLNLMVNYNHKF